ncbi:MAG: hypothetical protein UC991_03840 [Gemmiger sp.]|uniref:hypothetical protein n=1 Tax=Gemmiger sp. TaxID=2049027 RepID=UPI002E772209|nr:hypothetical protein [Gemmiger sp.]MEE0497601.1 hypothetical protein [Gemmiger sp.]
MRSIKTKLFSLAMAVSMVLALAGCAMSTPSTVGSIGGVDIPAGIYLLAQYNSYSTASGLAKLATGETASDVKAVLKATCTGTINGEDVTASGSEYVAQLTTRAIEYYAAVEKQFAAQNGVLDDAATAEAANTADSLWGTNGDLYTANGISKATVETYLLNAQKAKVLLKMTYGPEGTTPVTEAEYTDYVNNDCYYIEAVQFPLVNYSSYAMADDTQKASIMATAESCMEELSRTATAETASGSALYTAAMTYVPQAMAAMGSEMDASQAIYYAASQLYTPDDLSSYGSDEYNNLTDPLDAAGLNHWTTIDLGTTILVARRIDPFKTYTVDELDSMYDLLTDMKSTAIQDELYAAGAALEHDLNSAALNTYSATKIKKNA